MELYDGIMLYGKDPWDPRGIPRAPWDLKGPRGHALGTPLERPWDPIGTPQTTKMTISTNSQRLKLSIGASESSRCNAYLQ